jgi:CheY-like chemotaxis protein
VDLARTEVEQLLAGGSRRTDQVDLAEVLSSVGDLLKPLCSRNGVSLRADLSVRFPALVCSRVALRQALLTILSTVVGAAAPGPVDVALSTRAGRMVIRVTAVLDAAVRPRPPTLDRGLPFVEALQGTLNMTTSGSPERISVEFAFPTSHGTSLLVVDNNPDFIRLVDRYVGGHGWEIVGAPDTDRASALLGQIRPTAILLDLVIPERDGWEFLVALKDAPETRDIPVIVCSVVREPEVALSLGATACLQKPIDQKQLLTVLQEVTAGSHGAT